MQPPYIPRLQMYPPQGAPGTNTLASPGAPYFASPASYSQLPFGGAGGGMISPEVGPSPVGFFPPSLQEQAHQNVGLGIELPPMAMQQSLGRSDAPSIRRSSSSSSSGSLAPAPVNHPSSFFPASHSQQRHYSQHVLFPTNQPVNGSSPPSRTASLPYQASSRTELHASTPSFHPSQTDASSINIAPPSPGPPAVARLGHNGRTQSISIRPGLKSPELSRAPSISPARSCVKDEGKKKKVVVRFPREKEEEDLVDDRKEGRKQSRFQRRPLDAEEKAEKERRIEHDLRSAVALEEDELSGGPQHPDEVKMSGLPETLEVFLPGKDAWEDVWDGFVQETNEKYGYCDLHKPSFLPSPARSTSFLSFDSSFPSTPHSPSGFSSPNPRSAGLGNNGNKHSRTASLFSGTPSALPPRLASVLDGFRRPGGHGSSQSLSFAGGFSGGLAALRGATFPSPSATTLDGSEGSKTRPNPLARSFTMPGWTASVASPAEPPSSDPPVALPPSIAARPVDIVRAAASTPLPLSPLGDEMDPLAVAGAALSPSQAGKWKPSLQDLGRGFRIEEEEAESEEVDSKQGGFEVDEDVAERVYGKEEKTVEEERLIETETARQVLIDSAPCVAEAQSPEHAQVDMEEDGESAEQKKEREAAMSAPSRRTSMMTDRTGVASDWDDSGSGSEAAEAVEDLDDNDEPPERAADLPDVELEEEAATRSADQMSPALARELSRALSDLGDLPRLTSPKPSLPPLPPLPNLPDLPSIEIYADGSSDEYDASESDGADVELSESEYSNPSEEENARVRAIYRARSFKALRDEVLEEHQHLLEPRAEGLDLPFDTGHPSERAFALDKASNLAVDPDVLFQAPSDVDASDVEKGGHKVNRNFEFPPRSLENSPIKKRDVEKVPPPSSPESLSNLLQPDLPPIVQAFGKRRSSLKVGAPEFTFVASGFGRRLSTASSNGSDATDAFGSGGKPGSLAASPRLLSASSPKIASSALNPGASDFRPSIFALQQRASSNSLDSGIEWGSTGQPGSINASSPGFTPNLGPSPPLDALASEFTPPGHDAAHHVFDFLPPSDAPNCVFPAGEPRKVSGGRGPLPPIPLTVVAPHAAAIKRQKVVSAGDSSWLPSIASSSMERIVSAPPLLAHPQPRRPLPNPPLQQFQRRYGAVEAEQEETDLQYGGGETANASLMSLDDPLPEQYAPTLPVVSRRAGEKASQCSLGVVSSFTANADHHGGADGKRMSPLPSFGTLGTSSHAGSPKRSREQASPARMGDPRARQESVDMVLPSAHRPRSKALPIPPGQEKPAGSDIFDKDVIPLTPASDGQGSILDLDEGPEEDDLPLRVLEGIIATQFETLKIELTALRPAAERDSLINALADRVELLLLTSRHNSLPDFAQLLSATHDRIESTINTAIERNQQPSVAHTLSGARSSLHPEWPMSHSAPTTPFRPTTPVFDGGPAAAYGSFLDDLRATVQPLTREQVDVEALAAKVAALVQPQLADILSRLPGESKSASPGLVDELRSVLADLATSFQAEKVNLADEWVAKLAPSLLPHATVNTLGTSIAAVVAQNVEEKLAALSLRKGNVGGAVPPLDADAHILRFTEAVKTAQAQREGDVTDLAAKEKHDKLLAASLATQDRLSQLSMDVTNRLDVAYSQLEALVKAQLASSSSSSGSEGDVGRKVAELEIQLAKSRNDHGRARSEKAVLSDHLEAEKTRHSAELDDLRQKLAQANDMMKSDALKTELAAARAQRIQEDLVAAKAEMVELEETRDLALKEIEEQGVRQRECENLVQQQNVEIARLKLEVEHQKALSRAARSEQAAVEKRLRSADVEKGKALEEKSEAKEALALATGTIAALEKRSATQDERLRNLERVKTVQQQTLAAANQRNANLRKEVAALKPAQADLASANLKISELEAALADSDARARSLLAENDQHRQQFSTIEQGLRTMKDKVTCELDDASSRIAALTDERDRLAEANSRLAEANSRLAQEKEGLLYRLSSSPHNLSSHFHPPSPDISRNGPSAFLSSAPDTPPSFSFEAKKFVKATALLPQHTGDSVDSNDTVAHTSFSPAPSISTLSFVPDDDGWYGPA
ncbi:hypothetical protein JCM11251_003325 [Rhodosporidiobolus azoricus]